MQEGIQYSAEEAPIRALHQYLCTVKVGINRFWAQWPAESFFKIKKKWVRRRPGKGTDSHSLQNQFRELLDLTKSVAQRIIDTLRRATRGGHKWVKNRLLRVLRKRCFFHLKLSLRVGVKFSKTILTVFYTLGLITIQYIIRLNFWCLETVNCSHKSKMTQYFYYFWNILGQIKLFCTKSCALR